MMTLRMYTGKHKCGTSLVRNTLFFPKLNFPLNGYMRDDSLSSDIIYN